MKLADERIKRLGDGYRAILDHNIAVPMAAVHIVDLCDTIEALRLENQQLQKQVARYKDLSTVKDEYIKLFLAEEKELVGIAAIHGWRGNLDRCDKGAELKAKIAELEIALTGTSAEYHNPADVEALKAAREALEQTKGFIKGIGCYCNYEGEYASQCQPCFVVEQIDKALAEIDKVIGGKEDEKE